MAPLDPERRLALAYAPAPDRPALAALWRLDATLGAVIAAGREPMIRQVKLAWWREALQDLDRGNVPPHPLLVDIAALLPLRGVPGAALAEMTEGWEHIVGSEALTPAELASFASLRGARLFGLSAGLLRVVPDGPLDRAGEGWALADLAWRSSRTDDAETALAMARDRLAYRWRWPARLRPLGILAELARRDAERGPARLERRGAPARLLRAFIHRITGL